MTNLHPLMPPTNFMVLQPIDTAPKDGTWFLAYRGPARVGTWDRFIVARWHDEFDDFIWADEPFDIFEDDIDRQRFDGRYEHSPYEADGTFTHWCPLPSTNPPQPHVEGRDNG